MTDEEVHIEGWKGRDDISVEQEGSSYVVYEHRKCKEDGQVATNKHVIPKENVKVLWSIIRDNCQYREEYKYKYLVRKVIEKYNIHLIEGLTVDQMITAFAGGKFRAKWYFPFYYSLKVLENKAKIIYLGRGGVIRISEDIEL